MVAVHESVVDIVVRELTATMCEPSKERVEHYRDYANKLVASRVSVVVDGGATESSLVMAIKQTPVGAIFGEADGNQVLIMLDLSVTGETITKPAHRQPPFRQNQAGKLLRSCIQARHGRAENLQLVAGDIYCIFDGSRRGIHGSLANLFGTEELGHGKGVEQRGEQPNFHTNILRRPAPGKASCNTHALLTCLCFFAVKRVQHVL